MKCPLQVHVLNAWSPADSSIWGGAGNFSWWGLARGIRSLRACSWGIYLLPGPHSPAFSLYLARSLLPVFYEVSDSAPTHPSTVIFCLPTGLNATEPAGHGQRPLKLWAKNGSSLLWVVFLKYLSQVGTTWEVGTCSLLPCSVPQNTDLL
jgi:hypothetical protein